MMNKVYVVMYEYSYQEPSALMSVCSTKAKAEEIKAQLIDEHEYHNEENYHIEEWVVDHYK